MNLRNSIRFLLCNLAGAAMLFGTAASAADLAAQSSEDGGVTIAVKPVDVSADAATWSFQVTLSSSGQELRDDLLRSAYLLNRAAKKDVPPIAWEGGAPAGRQRGGILRFNALKPMPAAIELRIQRAGEAAPRVYRWDLDCPCNDPKMHPKRA
jgi:hypothetical protein